MLQSPENLLTPYAPRRRSAVADPWFDLDDWVGPGHPSTRPDVAKLEAILANSGDFPMERFQGPTGYWGGALDAGIRAYQKRNGLEVDGTLRPDGPTISHMRDSFAGLFEGYEPPTVEEIDAHQNAVGDDNNGTIAWRKPPVDLSQVPGLPEIDQEADASNARLARAMLRTGDIEGYAPLMRDAIAQGGKRALAEVHDLTKKLDEVSPGLGGRFASSVVGPMTKEQIDALELKAPEEQPLGTKVAFTDVVSDAALALGGIFGLGAMAKKASDDATKILGKTDDFKLPGRTPADNESKPIQTPPPTKVDVPIHTGGTIEQLKASDNVETFPADPGSDPEPAVLPPLSAGERQQIVGKFLDEFTVAYEYENGTDLRGGPKTVKLNNVTAKACQKAISESEFPELIKQLGGASVGGDEVDYKKEASVDVGNGKKRRPDYLMGVTDEHGNIEHAAAINTATVRADGTPTPRETGQLNDLIKANVIRFVDFIAKTGKDGDPKDSFEEAYRKCKEGVKFLENGIRADIASGKRKIGKPGSP